MDELENVSGGKESVYYVPKTHEQIDALWDTIASIFTKYGRDLALISAMELNAFSGDTKDFPLRDPRTLDQFRNRMHRDLDGKLTDLEYHSEH